MFKHIMLLGGINMGGKSRLKDSRLKKLLKTLGLRLDDTEILKLERKEKTDEYTLGVLTLHDGTQFYTIEPPDKNNEINVSCVPEGLYMLMPHSGNRYKNTYAFVNPKLDVYHLPSDVPEDKKGVARTACVFHSANWAHQLRGCVAPGIDQRILSGKEAVTNSSEAMKQFREKLGLNKIKYILDIQDCTEE